MDDHFRAKLPLPGLAILPGTSAQFSLDEESRAFPDIIAKDLADPLVANQAVPLGALLPLTAVILVALAGGQREIDQSSTGKYVCLRIFAGMAQKNDFVDALSHGIFLQKRSELFFGLQ
jgi:hypothetical protein